jgi:retrograde regulation protein 2
MPTVYQDRCDISLFDAQYLEGRRRPIPDDIIENVISALLRYKRTCEDFGVPSDQIRVVATEATREAMNSQEYRDRIQSATGWTVELLPKEEEGRIGAMGIASSFATIKGLALDLGGGSIQMTWIISEQGEVEISPRGSISFPWGAAALMRLLGDPITVSAQEQLQREIAWNFEKAITDLKLPQTMLSEASKHGFTIYLSGGGFRGWGHILMSMHAINPYPIPIINGFRVPRSEFSPDSADVSIDDDTFRISARRSSQVPAVKLIILALIKSFPNISNIYFAQGGVREGLIFSNLPPSIRAQHPLVIATSPYGPTSAATLVALLHSLVPSFPTASVNYETSPLSSEFLSSVTHLSMKHSPLPKDIRSSAALRSTTSGLLANAHGISHRERALLGLALCERWGGEISPSDAAFFAALVEIVGAEAGWWAKYVGRAAQGIGNIFPAGLVRHGEEDTTVKLSTSLGVSSHTKKRNSDGSERPIVVNIVELRPGISGPVSEWQDALERVGKKKSWVGKQEKFGIRVEVQVKRWR